MCFINDTDYQLTPHTNVQYTKRTRLYFVYFNIQINGDLI